MIDTLNLSLDHVTSLLSLQVRVAGMYLTVLLDPHSFDTVLNDSVSLDLSHKKNKLLEHIFSLQLPGVKATDERRLMEE